MCGIAGIVGLSGQTVDRTALEAMGEALAHRGPNGMNFFVDQTVGFAHTRLAIIDLSDQGNQPMGNRDGSMWITYNGEVYNHVALRQTLQRSGRCFRSHCDTEVILQAYEEYGRDCVEHFVGMFAFALYDKRHHSVLLMRDRLGKKPLYYAETRFGFVFASEIKALFCAGVPRRANKSVLLEYLNFGTSIGYETPVEGVHSLPPGHWLRLDLATGRWEIGQYYDCLRQIEPDRFAQNADADEDQILRECRELLEKSIRHRLVADVPVGTLCSGGLDSSLVTALARREKDDVLLFTVDVRDPRLSERAAAERVATHLHADLVTTTLDRETFLRALPSCIYHTDTPLAHPNGVGIYLVSRLARENGVPVLLTGEGADELFGGYWRYARYHSLCAWQTRLGWVSERARDWLAMLALPKRVWRDRLSRVNVDAGVIAGVSNGFVERWSSREAARQAYQFLKTASERETQAMLAADLTEYLEPILQRQDRMSMQVGLESRVPFLDHHVVAFALNLPLRWKIHRKHGKWLLKRLAERYLPAETVWREKVGFGLPLSEWTPALCLLRNGFVQEHWHLPYERLRELAAVDESLAWMLVNIELWGRVCLWGETPDLVALPN
jgi:asparagine synthase (glutamine-hydrolysing)